MGPLRIVIDPGHGGKDPGAVGLNGTEEAQVNLAVGRYLHTLMEQAGANSWLTRTKDIFVPLPDRIGLAKRVNADLLISLHCNSGPGGAEGIETIYEEQRGPLDKEFAQALQDALCSHFKFHKNRGIKDSESDEYQRSIYLVQKAPCPAAIVEMEFISSPKQEFFLRKPETHDAIAFILRKAILEFARNRITANLVQ